MTEPTLSVFSEQLFYDHIFDIVLAVQPFASNGHRYAKSDNQSGIRDHPTGTGAIFVNSGGHQWTPSWQPNR